MSTPRVGFSFIGTVDGDDVYTKALRRHNTSYPLDATAIVQRTYNSAGSADDRLHRPRYQKLFDGNLIAGAVHQTMYYEYNGTGRVARTWAVGNQTPGTNIERTMATATGVYGTWDRFGRTLQQRWFRGTTTHDQVDYAGNRKWREDVVAAA